MSPRQIARGLSDGSRAFGGDSASPRCAGCRASEGCYSRPMASSSGFVPKRREGGLVTEHLEGEVLLYVEATHRAFCLNPAAAQIWELIDGARDVRAIARRARMEPELVTTTLDEMGAAGLLDAAPDPAAGVDLSRRRLVRAGLVAIPFIVAITVPRAAEAASACTVGLPGGPACSPTTPCCAGICNESLGTCG